MSRPSLNCNPLPLALPKFNSSIMVESPIMSIGLPHHIPKLILTADPNNIERSKPTKRETIFFTNHPIIHDMQMAYDNVWRHNPNTCKEKKPRDTLTKTLEMKISLVRFPARTVLNPALVASQKLTRSLGSLLGTLQCMYLIWSSLPMCPKSIPALEI